MYLVFFVSYALLLIIFLFKKREFDFISLYILTLYIYNSITLFGVTYDPYTASYISLDPRLYLSSSIPFLVAIPFVLYKNESERTISYSRFLVKNNFLSVGNIFTGLLFVGTCIGVAYVFPKMYGGTSKVEIMGATTQWEDVFTQIFPVAGAFISLINRNRIIFITFVGILLCVFLLGKRSPLVFAFLGCVLIVKQGRDFRPITKYKLIFFGLLMLLLVSLGKTFYSFLLHYGFSGISLWFDGLSWDYIFSGLEGSSASTILNAVIKNDFSIEGQYILKSLLAINPLPLSYFEFSSDYFNQVFQSTLFPGINYGMAYNPWAEAYSWLGNIGISIYSFIFLFLLRFLWKAYKSSSREFGVIFLFLGIITAFWLHRNSLASILAYNRNALYPLLTIYLLYWCLKHVLPLKSKES